jgi:valyl-tRNA synthetase
MEFGTGAVKVTPAHDLNDFKCGERNNLDFLNILNDDGTFNENTGPFEVCAKKRWPTVL